VHTKLEGCGKRAGTKDVIDFPGRNPRLRGESNPLQNDCGTGFNTFILGERGIQLCEACLFKLGLIW
jgi:hypothetical protein